MGIARMSVLSGDNRQDHGACGVIDCAADRAAGRLQIGSRIRPDGIGVVFIADAACDAARPCATGLGQEFLWISQIGFH